MTTVERKTDDDAELAAWLHGQPVHGVLECCPDFSCCHPDLLQPIEVRRAYVNGSQREREQLLAKFLAALVRKIAPGQVLVVGPE